MPSLPLFAINDIALLLALLIRVGSSVLELPLFFGPANVIPPLSYCSLLTAPIVVYLLPAYLASAFLLNLGILPKADHGWRETHGPHFAPLETEVRNAQIYILQRRCSSIPHHRLLILYV
jgi:hypothetical protein